MRALRAFSFGMVHAPIPDKGLISLEIFVLFIHTLSLMHRIGASCVAKSFDPAPRQSLCQSLQNRAIGTRIALAMNCQVRQRFPHLGQLRYPAIQFFDVLKRNGLDL
jgi:hypothetical protein